MKKPSRRVTDPRPVSKEATPFAVAANWVVRERAKIVRAVPLKDREWMTSTLETLWRELKSAEERAPLAISTVIDDLREVAAYSPRYSRSMKQAADVLERLMKEAATVGDGHPGECAAKNLLASFHQEWIDVGGTWSS